MSNKTAEENTKEILQVLWDWDNGAVVKAEAEKKVTEILEAYAKQEYKRGVERGVELGRLHAHDYPFVKTKN